MEPKELKERYDEYKARIEARKAAGEADLKVIPIDKWKRVLEIEDTEHPGKTKKVTLPGISGETKKERGARVAENRMNRFLDAVDRLDQATSAAYAYTDTQVDTITGVIKTSCDRLIANFERKKGAPAEEKVTKKKFQF